MIRWLTDPYASEFMRRAAVVAVLVGVLAPAVGVWVVLRRLAYLGDAMSHGTLAGVAGAYLAGVAVTIGALVVGVAMGIAVGALERQRRLGRDTIIGVVETLLFAVGVLLISRSDRIGVDLSHYLFGQIVTVSNGDVVVAAALTAAAVTALAFAFGDLRSVTFDEDHARQVGISVGALRTLLMVLVSVTVVVSLDTVGLLMSVALLVTPAAAARLVTRRTGSMTALSVGIGVTSSLGGLTISYHASTPPGPTIALVAVGCFAVALASTWPRRHRAAELIAGPRSL